MQSWLKYVTLTTYKTKFLFRHSFPVLVRSRGHTQTLQCRMRFMQVWILACVFWLQSKLKSKQERMWSPLKNAGRVLKKKKKERKEKKEAFWNVMSCSPPPQREDSFHCISLLLFPIKVNPSTFVNGMYILWISSTHCGSARNNFLSTFLQVKSSFSSLKEEE